MQRGAAFESEGRIVADLRRRFQETFGRADGVRVFFAPGRVNLMGAHLDYNRGPVMPVSIDQGTYVALRARDDERVRLASCLLPEGLDCAWQDAPPAASGAWVDYPLGVLQGLRRTDGTSRGIEALFGGNLPIGAGLSSSASICVATAFAWRALLGREPDPLACIEAALWGERQFVGVQCGIMDPYAVTLTRPGHVLWLDCRDASFQQVPFDGALTVSVVDSGVRRKLAQGAFNQRVEECARALAVLQRVQPGATCLRDVPLEALEEAAPLLGPLLLKRARHVAGEVQRTFAARRALETADFERFGELVSATHASLRDLYEVSTAELDRIVSVASAWDGVLGARLTGAGFGGCAVIVLRTAAVEGFAAFVKRGFSAAFGREPEVHFFGSGGGPREVVADAPVR